VYPCIGLQKFGTVGRQRLERSYVFPLMFRTRVQGVLRMCCCVMKSHPLLPTQPLVTITNEEITLVFQGRGLYETVWGWNRVQRATLFASACVGLLP
jgi:hypothetical protein